MTHILFYYMFLIHSQFVRPATMEASATHAHRSTAAVCNVLVLDNVHSARATLPRLPVQVLIYALVINFQQKVFGGIHLNAID